MVAAVAPGDVDLEVARRGALVLVADREVERALELVALEVAEGRVDEVADGRVVPGVGRVRVELRDLVHEPAALVALAEEQEALAPEDHDLGVPRHAQVVHGPQAPREEVRAAAMVVAVVQQVLRVRVEAPPVVGVRADAVLEEHDVVAPDLAELAVRLGRGAQRGGEADEREQPRDERPRPAPRRARVEARGERRGRERRHRERRQVEVAVAALLDHAVLDQTAGRQEHGDDVDPGRERRAAVDARGPPRGRRAAQEDERGRGDPDLGVVVARLEVEVALRVVGAELGRVGGLGEAEEDRHEALGRALLDAVEADDVRVRVVAEAVRAERDGHHGRRDGGVAQEVARAGSERARSDQHEIEREDRRGRGDGHALRERRAEVERRAHDAQAHRAPAASLRAQERDVGPERREHERRRERVRLRGRPADDLDVDRVERPARRRRRRRHAPAARRVADGRGFQDRGADREERDAARRVQPERRHAVAPGVDREQARRLLEVRRRALDQRLEQPAQRLEDVDALRGEHLAQELAAQRLAHELVLEEVGPVVPLAGQAPAQVRVQHRRVGGEHEADDGAGERDAQEGVDDAPRRARRLLLRLRLSLARRRRRVVVIAR